LPRQRSKPATSEEMTELALSFRPVLLQRAVQLLGNHHEIGDTGAEDLVQGAYLAFVAKPPEMRSPSQLKNWFRLVMRNLHARRSREYAGGEYPDSWDRLMELRRTPTD
jgi:DNA-directed RNA polymerase specialized sigma24 family protein